MNLSRELILYLANETAFIAGVDLFQGLLPVDILEGFTFTQIGGNETDSNLMQSIISMTAVYRDYDTAHDNLMVVYKLLAYSHGATFGSVSILESTPIKHPGMVTRTEQGYYIFSCSVVFNYERT